MNALLRTAVLALPLIGLAGLWGLSDYESRQGTEWDVEVNGYDPRDLLRGHYVEFTYDWEGEIDAFPEGVPPMMMCLEGTPPGPPRVSEARADCDYPVEADYGSVYGADGLVRGRLYVGQERAREIEEKMFDPDLRGIARVRLGTNRRLTPIDIRFRPLTEEEQAVLDEANELETTPPPIMIESSE